VGIQNPNAKYQNRLVFKKIMTARIQMVQPFQKQKDCHFVFAILTNRSFAIWLPIWNLDGQHFEKLQSGFQVIRVSNARFQLKTIIWKPILSGIWIPTVQSPSENRTVVGFWIQSYASTGHLKTGPLKNRTKKSGFRMVKTRWLLNYVGHFVFTIWKPNRTFFFR
jgi:hypothetical protein